MAHGTEAQSPNFTTFQLYDPGQVSALCFNVYTKMMATQDKQFKLELVVYFQEDEIDRKPDCVTVYLGRVP